MATQTAAAAGSQRPDQQVTEHEAQFLAGLPMLVLGVAGLLAGVVLAVVASRQGGGVAVALAVLCVVVSNLLVVLCSEQATQPVVNTGTLYQ